MEKAIIYKRKFLANSRGKKLMKSEKENFNKSKYSYLIQNTALLTLSSFGSKIFVLFFGAIIY